MIACGLVDILRKRARELLVIRCTSDGAVQLIWAPPFAPSTPG